MNLSKFGIAKDIILIENYFYGSFFNLILKNKGDYNMNMLDIAKKIFC